MEKRAGRELAAFLRAVEQTQGADSVEKAGAIWIDALSNRPQSDFCSQASFRSISVEAASSLVSLLGEASLETLGEPACIDQAKSGKIHLVTGPAKSAMGAQSARGSVVLMAGNRRRMGAAGLELVS